MIEWKEYKEDCCVVVPVYKHNLTLFEQSSLMQCVRVFGKKRDIFLVVPHDLDIEPYTSLCPNYKFRVRRFSDEFFTSVDGYNEMCKRSGFYSAFSDYRYMLIYQLDCWVFNDNIDYFISLGYDYIGAPWVTLEGVKITSFKCGNGGFSLRNVEKLKEVCEKYVSECDDRSPEDVFFCEKCGKDINVSPPEIGMQFSFEVGPSVFFKLNGNKLPMGCHKPFLFEFKNFWRDYIKF